MKKPLTVTILTLFLALPLSGQKYFKLSDPSYRFVSSPGSVDIAEINGAYGVRDSTANNASHFFSITNVFGYQVDRNFFAGIGVGLYFCENRLLIPIYLENKFSVYLNGITPFLYANGGLLQSPADFLDESKIFINPGIGLSRYISSKIEGSFSVGYMIQARTTLTRVSFLNFKMGLIFRNNPYRMFKKKVTRLQ